MGSEVRDALDAYLSFQLSELEGSLPLIAAADQEAVHSARLALRRLRSVLSCYKSALPRLSKQTRNDIRWLARSLGEARDAYVQALRFSLWLDATEEWRSPGGLHGAVDLLVARSNQLATRAGTGARASEVIRATREGLFACDEPKGIPVPDRAAAVVLLQREWATARQSLLAASTVAPEGDRNELLHRARKDIKSLRYSVEAVADVMGSGATAILQPAMALQRILGEQHDSVTGIGWVGQLAGTPGIDDVDAGELLRMEQRRLSASEALFRTALLTHPLPEPRIVLLE
ncbi:CHAD domain-containing protein [Paenarthrobacter sp. NPDC089322]|uniref:CHAD domain-containing protein n=1 Tax=Paenarthrobacter sp. NPDC089322 TaxID=3155065 RepID=UPI00341DA2AD